MNSDQAMTPDTEQESERIVLGVEKESLLGQVTSAYRDAWMAQYVNGDQNWYNTLIACQNTFQGKYTDAALAAVKKQIPNGSEAFLQVSTMKCRTAMAILAGIYNIDQNSADYAIVIPTPNPDTGPELLKLAAIEMVDWLKSQGEDPRQFLVDPNAPIGQDGMPESALTPEGMDILQDIAKKITKRAAEKTSILLQDAFIEGDFNNSLSEFITSLVTFPTAFLAGPYVCQKPVKKISRGADGKMKVEHLNKRVYRFENVYPGNMFWSPSAAKFGDGFVVRRHLMQKKQFSELRKIEGFDHQAVTDTILANPNGVSLSYMWDQVVAERAQNRNWFFLQMQGRYEVLEYWGEVFGQYLQDGGIPVEDVTEFYDCCVWFTNGKILKAVINPDPLCRKPFYSCSYVIMNDSVMGQGVIQINETAQVTANAAARALHNNTAFSSVPMTIVDRSLLNPDTLSEDILRPGAILEYNCEDLVPQAQNHRPVEFYQPPNNAEINMRTISFCYNMASEATGIPTYASGGPNVGGAGDTASGLAMLKDGFSQLMMDVVKNIDARVIGPAMEYLLDVLCEDPDLAPECAGDVILVANGFGQRQKDESRGARLLQLAQMVFQNQTLTGILGEQGAISLLREVAKSFDADGMVPTEKEVERRMIEKYKAQQQQAEAEQVAQAQQNALAQQGIAMKASADQQAQAVQQTHQAAMQQQQQGHEAQMAAMQQQHEAMMAQGGENGAV